MQFWWNLLYALFLFDAEYMNDQRVILLVFLITWQRERLSLKIKNPLVVWKFIWY